MIAAVLLVPHLAVMAAVAAGVPLSKFDVGVFSVAAAVILAGGVGVVVARNPVHAALMLVMTLFGVAVMFVLQRDDFLAAVQVIVYAGAIVVLFLFVIMFLGVDREENLRVEPLRGQRPLAVGLGILALAGTLVLGSVSSWTTGPPSVSGAANAPGGNVALLGRSVFTTYLFPFEVTAALLVIAVVGAVVLARRPPSPERPVTADVAEPAPAPEASTVAGDDTETPTGSETGHPTGAGDGTVGETDPAGTAEGVAR